MACRRTGIEMRQRVARHAESLDEVVASYRDGGGLIETGGFRPRARSGGVR
jgi:hypothetical protein